MTTQSLWELTSAGVAVLDPAGRDLPLISHLGRTIVGAAREAGIELHEVSTENPEAAGQAIIDDVEIALNNPALDRPGRTSKVTCLQHPPKNSNDWWLDSPPWNRVRTMWAGQGPRAGHGLMIYVTDSAHAPGDLFTVLMYPRDEADPDKVWLFDRTKRTTRSARVTDLLCS